MATRGWRSLVAGAVVAGLLAGCGSDDGGDKASASSAECPNGELTFGVQPYEAAALLRQAFEPMGKELGKALGCPVKVLISQSYTAEIEAMRAGKLDMGHFGPLAYLLADELAGVDAVATYADARGRPSTYTASIVTKRDSGIASLADLKGKSLAYSDSSSTSGYLYPAHALEGAGLDPQRDVEAVFAGSHPAALEAVRNDKVDAAELNSTTARVAEGERSYDPGEYRAVWTSDPIPVDPIVVRRDLPAPFKRRLEAALLRLDFSGFPENVRDVLAGLRLARTGEAAYDPVRRVVQELGVDLRKVAGG